MTTSTTSFAKDIAPMFRAFQGPMIWRFDLTNYDHVKPNAMIIYERLNNPHGPMPPPPYPPLTPQQIALFKQWMLDGTPP
jgi:hypothetical protein